MQNLPVLLFALIALILADESTSKKSSKVVYKNPETSEDYYSDVGDGDDDYYFTDYVDFNYDSGVGKKGKNTDYDYSVTGDDYYSTDESDYDYTDADYESESYSGVGKKNKSPSKKSQKSKKHTSVNKKVDSDDYSDSYYSDDYSDASIDYSDSNQKNNKKQTKNKNNKKGTKKAKSFKTDKTKKKDHFSGEDSTQHASYDQFSNTQSYDIEGDYDFELPAEEYYSDHYISNGGSGSASRNGQTQFVSPPSSIFEEYDAGYDNFDFDAYEFTDDKQNLEFEEYGQFYDSRYETNPYYETSQKGKSNGKKSNKKKNSNKKHKKL